MPGDARSGCRTPTGLLLLTVPSEQAFLAWSNVFYDFVNKRPVSNHQCRVAAKRAGGLEAELTFGTSPLGVTLDLSEPPPSRPELAHRQAHGQDPHTGRAGARDAGVRLERGWASVFRCRHGGRL